MATSPARGACLCTRQRKSCCRSSTLGTPKLVTATPRGLNAPERCLTVPSFPAASRPCSTIRTQCVRAPHIRSCSSNSSSLSPARRSFAFALVAEAGGSAAMSSRRTFPGPSNRWSFIGLLGRRPALLEREVAFLVLLARATGAGVVAADARTRPDDGRGLVLHHGATLPTRRRGRFAVGLDGRLRAPLRQRRQRGGGRAALHRLRGCRLLLHRLHPHHHGDGAAGDAALHDLEEVEAFLLVLDLRVLLAVPAQVDALAQMVHL